jgi:hypothetical protein
MFVRDNSKKLINLIFIEIVKDKRAYHTQRLVNLLMLIGCDEIQNVVIPNHILNRLFCHKQSAKICSILNQNNILDLIVNQIDNVLEEQERHDLVEQMIQYNNYISIDKLVKCQSIDLNINHIIWASLLSNEDTIITCLDGFKQKQCNKRLKKCIITVCMAKHDKRLYDKLKQWVQCTYADE